MFRKLWTAIVCGVGAHEWGSWEYKSEKSCEQVRYCARKGCDQTETRMEHTWDDWQYENEGSCLQIQICQRCNEKKKGEEKHAWSEWAYVTLDTWQLYIARLRKTRKILIDRFNMSDLKDLCLHLGVDIENISGENKAEKASELVKYAELHHRMDELVKVGADLRPDIPWEEMGMLQVINDAGLAELNNFDIEKLSWKFDPSESCTQLRVCKRCNVRETRKQHRWSDKWVYQSPDSCLMAMYCQRCGQKIEEKLGHQWGEWVESSKVCCLVRICQRCGEQEVGKRIPHRWSNWEYESPQSCRLVRRCQHCIEEEVKKEIKHSWSEWDYEAPDSCRLVRTCQRCGAVEVQEEPKHIWGNWQGNRI